MYISRHTYIIDVRMHMYIFNHDMYTYKKTIRIFLFKKKAHCNAWFAKLAATSSKDLLYQKGVDLNGLRNLVSSNRRSIVVSIRVQLKAWGIGHIILGDSARQICKFPRLGSTQSYQHSFRFQICLWYQ